MDLLNRGAHVILSENHLLEMLESIPMLDSALRTQPALALSESKPNTKSSQQKNRDFSHLEPELAQIMSIMTGESLTLDAIAEKTALDTSKLLASLSKLELMGLISQLPGMRYSLV